MKLANVVASELEKSHNEQRRSKRDPIKLEVNGSGFGRSVNWHENEKNQQYSASTKHTKYAKVINDSTYYNVFSSGLNRLDTPSS